MSSKAKIILSISVLAIVAIVIYIFSIICPWIGDDINYQFKCGAGTLQRISSIWDIFVSQWHHYFTVNGRYVAHWIVQLFCGLLGQQVFAVCNAFIYITYILLVLKIGNGNFKQPLAIISASLLTLIACDTFYAPACQVGFVWSFVLVFIWLYFFFNRNTKSFFKLSLLFLFSIIAGNSQEAITIGISGALIIYAITNFKKITIAQWVAFFGFGIGTLLICISPATISRSDNLNVPFLLTTFKMVCYFRVFYILIIILSIKLFRQDINVKEFYQKNSFYINAIIILLIFNMYIGVYGNRQLFGIEAISIILILRLLKDYFLAKKTLIFLSVFTLIIYSLKWEIISQSKITYHKILELYSNSQNGIIYYTLTDFSESCHIPNNTDLIQPILPMHTSQNYLTETITKLYQSQTRDTSRVLKIYPTYLQNINDSTQVENQAVEFDEGCFVVVQSKENPADFIVKRTLDLFFYKRPYSDYKFSWDNPQFEGPNYKANIIYQAVPFVTNDSIIIE